MNKLIFLLRIQILSFFRLNKMNLNGTKKERKRSILFLIGLFLGFILIESYFFSMVYSWLLIGLTFFIPSILFLFTEIICFILTFMKSSGLIFGYKDFDLLISLPISPRLLLLSRFLFVYLINLGVSCLSFFIPMIFFWCQGYFSLLSLIVNLGVTILIPILPMVVAILASLLLSYLASYFRHTNLFIILFNFLLILLLGFGAVSLNSMQSNNFSSLTVEITDLINDSHPLINFLQSAINSSSLFDFLIIIFISLFSSCLTIIGLGNWYLVLNSRFSAKQASTKFQWKSTKKRHHFLHYTKENGHSIQLLQSMLLIQLLEVSYF